MNVFLMHRDHDFDLDKVHPSNESELIQDLQLDTLFNAMARDDMFLLDIAKHAVLVGLTDIDSILYRQSILQDCLKNDSIIQTMYNIAVESIANEKKNRDIFREHPDARLHRSIEVMQMFVGMMKKLRSIADEHVHQFLSQGFARFFTMLGKELTDDYFSRIENHLNELKFHNGMLISVQLGVGNQGSNHILLKHPPKKHNWMDQIFMNKRPVYVLSISDRDESGISALTDLKDKGINLVANALAQAVDHILSFFITLRTELAFYVGCLNLYEQLMIKGEPTCFPVPYALNERRESSLGLYDICLALSMEQRVVGNDVFADNMDFVIITGANQGGKSTFLRSIGSSQLMMQSGLFVPATSFSANICNALFTHFQRKEDIVMNSGKLDEELNRMSDIADHITSNCMILFNESFAATNEREGSEIAGQISRALVEKQIKVFFVTHFYEFARGFYDEKMKNTMYLRAQRQMDGERTFKLIEGEPLQTSYGDDLYRKIFNSN